jgi:hypothetical protein
MSRRSFAEATRSAARVLVVAIVVLPIVNAWISSDDAGPGERRPLSFTKSSSPSLPRKGGKPRKSWVRKAVLPKTTLDGIGLLAKRKPPDAPMLKPWSDAPQPRPTAITRLENCTEFTKPAAVCIRLTGTPKNHRSPPA